MNPAALDRLLWKSRRQPPQHPQTRMVGVDGACLRLRDSGGDSPPLVFLCDPPVTVEAYDTLIAEFSPQYRVLVVELTGFGFSRPATGDQLRFRQTVAAVESALSSILERPAVLLGPCICGFVAAEIARRGTLAVAGLVFMQTPDVAGMLAWRDRMDPKGLLRTPYLGQMLVRARAGSLTPFWLRYATGRDFDATQLCAHSTQALRAGAGYPLATMLQTWDDVSDHPLQVPARVIWGRQDRSHASTNPRCTLAHVPDAEVIEFSHCGHFSELERPAEFAAALRPFLEQVLNRN